TWMTLATSAAVLTSAFGSVVPALAQATITPEQALDRLFSADQVNPDWFTPSFLAQVPASQIQVILSQETASLGAYQSVQKTANGYVVSFAKGTLLVKAIVLDDRGRFSTLLLGNPQFQNSAGALDQALSQLQALPGQVSLLILKNGQQMMTINAGMPLAVGSTFKLAVLTALRRQIDAGRRNWADVVALDPAWKSLPSGILQDWPDGSPLTLQTLASLMISISDNTAANSLIQIAGRDAVDAVAPARDRPFLTTREAFVLKDPANSDLHDQYLNGGMSGRLAALQAADSRPLPGADVFANGTGAPEVEWFFTVGELCDLMNQVADLPLMGIDPGVTDPNEWTRIAFKGGGETGVLNLTHGLQNSAGDRYCVSATWNNTVALDDNRFSALVGQILSTLG
ncbi:MAG: serine hydrolase, partial [Dehalococcoidia bacterium]